MWLATIVLILLVSYSHQQETMKCVGGTTQCFADVQKYFRCPSTGVYDVTKIAENSYDCPTENSIQLRCLNAVKTGQKSATDTLDAQVTTGPCLQITCASAGIFGAGSINIGACGAYYACSEAAASPTIINCSLGQHFNNATLKCEAAATAGCDPSLTTTPAPTTTPSATTTTPQATTTKPVVCRGPGRIADPADCKRYYTCGFIDDEPKSNTRCPFASRFNVATLSCARNVDCGTRPDLN